MSHSLERCVSFSGKVCFAIEMAHVYTLLPQLSLGPLVCYICKSNKITNLLKMPHYAVAKGRKPGIYSNW